MSWFCTIAAVVLIVGPIVKAMEPGLKEWGRNWKESAEADRHRRRLEEQEQAIRQLRETQLALYRQQASNLTVAPRRQEEEAYFLREPDWDPLKRRS